MLNLNKVNLFQFLILSLTILIPCDAHGRLLSPMPRALNRGYENDPVRDPRESQPLSATAGNDWVCRHSSATNVQMTLTAGAMETFDYRLTARHVGDCDFSISYDWDKPLEQMKWFKIANFPNCKDQGTMVPDTDNDQVDSNRVTVRMPSWLKAGRAVLRWGWWGIHNWPSVEFFNQCSDVEINGVQELPTEVQTYSVSVYPKDANDRVGYRNAWDREKWGTPAFWMTGPACAMGSDFNNCLFTAYGTKGNVGISGNPTGTFIPSTGKSTPLTRLLTLHLGCSDIKPSMECQNADQVWNMCDGGGSWWVNQCKATCNQC